jgi:hypothetical protein
MATYKGINGFAVQSVATDPSPLDEGQVWYNNATYAFKLASVTTSGTWATGGNLNTARSWLVAAQQGTQTAALVIGGDTTGSGSITGATEEYNGTAWTSKTSASALYQRGGAGNITAALVFGGHTPQSAATESYNGTSWTPGTSLPTATRTNGGVGTQTAALSFGGGYPVGSIAGATNKYNGSSWTSSGAMTIGLAAMGVAGIQTAALSIGGSTDPSTPGATLSYNGTSWTTVNSLNTAKGGLAGSGSQTLAIAFGAGSPSVTELWNGTSWTNNPTGLSNARSALAGCGTQGAALASGGTPIPGAPPQVNATEEWTGPGAPVTRTITTS